MRGRGVIGTAVVLAVALGAGIGVAAVAEPLTGPPVPLRAPRALPPAGEAGDAVVELSADARTHPAAALVRDQLQAHYRAINDRDRAAWADTVSPQRVAQLDPDKFARAYATTTDGTIRIDRIDDLPGRRVLVRVRFISTQDPANAPNEARSGRTCWTNSLPMSGVPPLIELTESGSSRATPC